MKYQPSQTAVDVLFAFLWGLLPTDMLQRAYARAVEEDLYAGHLVNPYDVGVGPWQVYQITGQTESVDAAYQVSDQKRVVASWINYQQAVAIAASLNASWAQGQ